MKAILATFLADAVGLRCRLLIAVVLSVRAHEVSCRVRAGEVARPAIVSGWKRRRLHPKGPQAAPGSYFGGPVGSPPPSTVFVGVPAQRMELGAKGRGGPAAGKGSAGLGHDGNV